MIKRVTILATALAILGFAVALSGFTSLATAQVAGVNGRIAFTRFDPASDAQVTYIANPDGSHLRMVYPGEYPHWSPDGRELAVQGAGPSGADDLAAVVVNVDTGQIRELTMPGLPGLFTVCTVWSADGRRLACEGWNEDQRDLDGIYTISAVDGGDLTRLTSPVGGHDIPGDYSPDGSRLVFSRGTVDGDLALFVANADGTNEHRITSPGTIVQTEFGGSWSPSGDQILFQARSAPDQRFSVWMVGADGSNQHQVPVPECGGAISDPSSNGCFGPVWSPDGSRIMFTQFAPNTGQGKRNLMVVNPDGTGMAPVTHSGRDDEVSWGIHPVAP